MTSMKTSVDRVNRTGMELAGARGDEMLEASFVMRPSSEGDESGIHEERLHYAAEGHVLGSMPPGVEGPMALLLDKLGQRLAFERTGVRLYDALMDKLEHAGGFEGGPRREDLARIRDEEAQHFVMLEQALRDRGADPTLLTPSADVGGTLGMGFCKVMTDPRTSLAQGLDAILSIELTDNAGWESLIDVAQRLGDAELERRCGDALRQEEQHLHDVKGWVWAHAARLAGGRGGVAH
jgi:rubrerythrin